MVKEDTILHMLKRGEDYETIYRLTKAPVEEIEFLDLRSLGWQTITEAAEERDYSRRSVYRLIYNSDIEAKKTGVDNVWLINPKTFDHYVTTKQGSWDGRRRYILHIHPLDQTLLEEFMEERGIEYSLELAYKGEDNG